MLDVLLAARTCRIHWAAVISVLSCGQTHPQVEAASLAAQPALDPRADLTAVVQVGVPAAGAPRTVDASAPAPPDATVASPPDVASFPPPWCARAGASERDVVDTLAGVAFDYYEAQLAACETAGLTVNLTDEQSIDWYNYLGSYGLALAGCPLIFGPIEGGILVFGLANTGVVGVEPPRLGPDDVDLLIAQYVTPFGDALQLAVEERNTVARYLASVAEPLVDPAISGALSRCGALADAGP